MQTYDVFSMWITDGVINSLHEATLEATGSIDASRKFLHDFPTKAKMGILSNFYYTQQSANACLVAGEHRFVNLIAVHQFEPICEPVDDDDPMVQDNIVYIDENAIVNEEETLDDNQPEESPS